MPDLQRNTASSPLDFEMLMLKFLSYLTVCHHCPGLLLPLNTFICTYSIPCCRLHSNCIQLQGYPSCNVMHLHQRPGNSRLADITPTMSGIVKNHTLHGIICIIKCH